MSTHTVNILINVLYLLNNVWTDIRTQQIVHLSLWRTCKFSLLPYCIYNLGFKGWILGNACRTCLQLSPACIFWRPLAKYIWIHFETQWRSWTHGHILPDRYGIEPHGEGSKRDRHRRHTRAHPRPARTHCCHQTAVRIRAHGRCWRGTDDTKHIHLGIDSLHPTLCHFICQFWLNSNYLQCQVLTLYFLILFSSIRVHTKTSWHRYI